MSLDPAELQDARFLIERAWAEDLGERGDLTSAALIPEESAGAATVVARMGGVLAGLPLVELLLERWRPSLAWQAFQKDGARLAAGDRVGKLSGKLGPLLSMERTLLNFLQHLSGIATMTRRFVDAVAGLPVRILDTRKTLPGWRRLAKYAVRQGGGTNHRLGLHDGILIKDNHLAGLAAEGEEPIAAALERAKVKRREWEKEGVRGLTVEIEVDNLGQLEIALLQQPDIILLDNMTTAQMRQAVDRRNATAAEVLLEASGGVTLSTVRAIAESGVDRISVGALTHSAPALDLALDYEDRQ